MRKMVKAEERKRENKKKKRLKTKNLRRYSIGRKKKK